jgi:hypothetical protein
MNLKFVLLLCYYLSSVAKTCIDLKNSAVYESFNQYLTIGFPCYSLYQSYVSVGIKNIYFFSKVLWICDFPIVPVNLTASSKYKQMIL